ncbi:MAG: HU family DNA-binding protein [Desulfovibrio sp.]|nr:HU family DNA-binding protein [Desulfovibrio sp.]
MNGALTKADIVEAIYEKTEKNRTDVKNTVETLLLLMKQAIKKDHALLVSGFGKFEAYSASSGRNSTARKIWRNRYDACLFCHS